MRVAVTGSSGFGGAALTYQLEFQGHKVIELVRPGAPPGPGRAGWDPAAGTIEAAALEGLDAVVHLAGAGIGLRRWTRGYRATIQRSRVDGTLLLAQALAGLERPPEVLLSASATGWYGDRGDAPLTESSLPGTGFRAEVCQRWEGATHPAAQAGIRVVLLRFGVILGDGGGLLRPMLPLAQRGLAMRLGNGRQFMSWISLPDAVDAVVHLVGSRSVCGPVNVCAPQAVTNLVFARALSEACGRRGAGFVPAWLLEVLAGRRRAREVLLSSQRVEPAKLLGCGFRFGYPTIQDALRIAVSP